MSDTAISKIIQYGTNAARIAFVPNPAAGSKVLYIWYVTDSVPDVYIWNGAAWVKINTGGISELTGAITAGPGSGSQATSITNSAVTYAKIQDISATKRILGRKTAGAGIVEECTLSEVLDFITSAAQGDILYRGAASWARLPAGASGKFLKTLGAGADPMWDTAGGGAGGGWTFVTSATPSGTGGIMSFNNLSAYNEILLLYKGIRGSPDFNITARVRVSTDNGATYLNTSGDYVSLSTQGVETNEADMKMHGTLTNGLKTGWRTISNFNTTKPKNSWTPLDGGSYVIPTATALNAIQIFTNTGLDWDTVGTIYIFGR
jgi:hypothetical protein